MRLNRNNITRFAKNAVNMDIPRTRFNMPFKHITTANSGKLIPFYFQECLPGDTFEMRTKMLARMTTPEFPVMDTAYLDYYYFFVPNRLVWDNFREFMGENPNGAWTTNKVERFIPQYSHTFKSKGNGDYFGLPTLTNIEVSALPFRGLRLIWNEWFRSTALQDPLLVNKGDTEPAYSVGLQNDDLLPVCRFPDYFSTALPAPQYGEPVQIGLLSDVPVVTKGQRAISHLESGNYQSLFFDQKNGDTWSDESGHQGAVGLMNYTNSHGAFLTPGRYTASSDMGDRINISFVADSTTNDSPGSADGSGAGSLVPVNLWASTSDVGMVSINDLRLAFQVQKYRESLARGGSRYTEIITALFNVQSPDARLQRTEYIGGNRAIVEMSQVVQTSASDNVTPQGNVAGMSKTMLDDKSFTYSCVEHGMIIGVMCIRPVHSYQQGIDRFWTKKDTLDFYVPTLANIGEQPVYKKELYAYDPNTRDDVFGYQEAWADYRYRRSYVSGDMRSNSPNGSLDAWHYADDYASTPTLSDTWIEEDSSLIDRTLAVSSKIADQFLIDMYFDLVAVRPLPAYSIPGLIDHH